MVLVRHTCQVVLLFLMTLEYITTLKLLALTIPDYVLLGSYTTLLCSWKLEKEEKLYSVKWYKDGKEFFHHIPGNREPNKKYVLPGVNVLSFHPSGSNVTLSSAKLETEGRYRCEVSGERPLFLTVSDYANLKVVVIPKHGPLLNSLQRDTRNNLQINCTSGLSRPETQLAWYVNGVPAPTSTVLPLQYDKCSNGLYATSLGLNINLLDFYSLKMDLRLKCLATIASIYWKSNETKFIFSSQKFSKDNVTIHLNTRQISNINAAESNNLATFYFILLGIIYCVQLPKAIR